MYVVVMYNMVERFLRSMHSLIFLTIEVDSMKLNYGVGISDAKRVEWYHS